MVQVVLEGLCNRDWRCISAKVLNDLDVYLSPKEKIKILDVSVMTEISKESF